VSHVRHILAESVPALSSAEADVRRAVWGADSPCKARAAAGDLADALTQHTAALAVATETNDHDERVRVESGLALIGRHDQRTEGTQDTS
jgi:hypothetical protein